MNPIGPREKHVLEQIQALTLEVSAMKKDVRDRLVSEGWDPAEAWGQAQRFEEITLGRVLEEGTRLLPVTEALDRFLGDLLSEEEP